MNLNILIIINKEKNKMNFNQSKLTKQEWETIEIPLYFYYNLNTKT